jgi:type IV secretion system protein VirB6
VNNWTFISNLLTQMTQMTNNAGNGLLTGSLGYVLPIVTAGAIAWIAAQATAVSHGAAQPATLLHGIFRIAVVVAVLQSVATYNQWVGDVAQTLPNDVTNAISGAQGGITTGQAFDQVMNNAFKAGLVLWNSAPKYSFSGLVVSLVVVVFWGVAVICIGAAAMTYATSTVLLIFFIKIGPLFLALFAFTQTRRFGNGWVTAMVSAALTQIFAVAMLVLLIGAEQITLNQIVVSATGQDNSNYVNQIISILLGMFLFWVVWEVMKQASSFASAIAGGVHQRVNQAAERFTAMTTGAVKGSASLVAGGTSTAARTVAAAIQQRRVNRMVGG